MGKMVVGVQEIAGIWIQAWLKNMYLVIMLPLLLSNNYILKNYLLLLIYTRAPLLNDRGASLG
jgi:hypothetical protein